MPLVDVGFGSVHRQTMFKALFISIYFFLFLLKIQQTEHDLRILSKHSRQPHRTIQWIRINRMKFLNITRKRNKNILLSECISLETFLPFGRRFFLVSLLCSLFSSFFFLIFAPLGIGGHCSVVVSHFILLFFSYFNPFSFPNNVI